MQILPFAQNDSPSKERSEESRTEWSRDDAGFIIPCGCAQNHTRSHPSRESGNPSSSGPKTGLPFAGATIGGRRFALYLTAMLCGPLRSA